MPGSAPSFRSPSPYPAAPGRDRRSARPDYLGPDDERWLQALLDEYRRHAGGSHRRLRELLAEGLALPAPAARQSLAVSVLDGLCVEKLRPPVKPASLRAALFTAAAARPGQGRERIVADTAAALEIPAEQVDPILFADLPREHVVAAPPRALTPRELALRCNLAMVQRQLRKAHQVAIEVRGPVRAVVRLARMRGLICTVTRGAEEDEGRHRLELSGPLALFRRTITYGRALASMVPGLAWCDDFRLRAWCELDGRVVELEVRNGDPLFPAAGALRRDSRLEERFEREFAKAAPEWNLLAEPEVVEAGDQLLFPDFAIQHRREPARRWLLEITGFWTAEHVTSRLDRMSRAGVRNLILCLDVRRGCGGEAPADPRVVTYRSRIDAAEVLAVIDGSAHRRVPDLVDDGGAVGPARLEVEDGAQVVADGAALDPRRQPGGGVAVDAGRGQDPGAGPGGDALRDQRAAANRPGSGQVELPVDRLQGHRGVVRVAHGEGELGVDAHHRGRADDHTIELDPGTLDRTLDLGAPGEGARGDQGGGDTEVDP